MTIYLHRFVCFKRLHKHEEALEDLNILIDLRDKLQLDEDDHAVIPKQERNALLLENLTAIYLLNQRGILYSKLDKHDLALKDFNAAILQQENYGVAYSNRGLVYLNLCQYEKAIEDFSRAIQLGEAPAKSREKLYSVKDPGVPYIHRSYAYDQMGLYEKAIKDSYKAIELKMQRIKV
jgi:tetratricopeptide (TPR) repeat protein